MSNAVACPDLISYRVPSSMGFGPDAEYIAKYDRDINSSFKKAETLGRPIDEALNVLDEVYEECSEENWDGFGALPIKEEAYLEARRLIRSIPFTYFIPVPEITPEPNGTIGLEWHKGKRRVFVASVGGKNEIVYAGLFGSNKTNGTEYFGDTLPSKIIENLQRLYIIP